jgi:hypothetical protein
MFTPSAIIRDDKPTKRAISLLSADELAVLELVKRWVGLEDAYSLADAAGDDMTATEILNDSLDTELDLKDAARKLLVCRREA